MSEATPVRYGAEPVLLTGVTGFVGMELLVRLLLRTDREVIALVRGTDDGDASARIDELLKTLIAPARRMEFRARVRAVASDLEQPLLGLSQATWDGLAACIGAVVHCAASVRHTLELADARRINVGGTREILRLARDAYDSGHLDRIVHVSSAYVAGDRAGRPAEGEADVGQHLRNTYERTKLEGEQVVRASGLPVAIVRPSIVVGDSGSGWTPAFNTIYPVCRAIARGVRDPLPGDPAGRVDIVPIDIVADVLLDLLHGVVRDETFHVVAGDEAATVEQVTTMAADFFGVARARFLRPGEDPSRAERRVGSLAPYFKVRCTFDARRARSVLGAKPPPLCEYFDALMEYCRDAEWGRVPKPRWASVSAAA